MKEEGNTFLRNLLPFLIVPFISVGGVFFLRGNLFND